MTFGAKNARFLRRFDPVVLCYLGGFILGQIAPPPAAAAAAIAGLGVLFCIPLMLMPFDLRASFRALPMAFLAMAFFGFLVCVMSVLVAAFFDLPSKSIFAGMLAATFVGSAPNLASVGLALHMPHEDFLLVQATDLLLSGSFFLFIIAIFIPFLFKKVPLAEGPRLPQASWANQPAAKKWPLAAYTKPLLGCLLLVGLSLLVRSFFATQKNLATMLTISLLSLLMAMLPKKAPTLDTKPLGEFSFLFFCAAIGSQLKPSILLDINPSMVAYGFTVLFLSVTCHFFFCKKFSINKNLFLVSFSAGIFSPAMITPIASRSSDKALVPIGLTIAVFGLSLGTGAGLLVHYVISLGGF